MSEPTEETPNPPARPSKTSPPAGEIDSRDLMRGARELIIRHVGETYRLTVTRSGKLILRK